MQQEQYKHYLDIASKYAYIKYTYIMEHSVYLPDGKCIVTESPVAKKLYNEG